MSGDRDDHGTRHLPGCSMPGWLVQPSTLAGWNLLACVDCGVNRLQRTSTTTATRSATA